MVFYFQRDDFRLCFDRNTILSEGVEYHMIGSIITDNSTFSTVKKRAHRIGAFAASRNEYFADNAVGKF